MMNQAGERSLVETIAHEDSVIAAAELSDAQRIDNPSFSVITGRDQNGDLVTYVIGCIGDAVVIRG